MKLLELRVGRMPGIESGFTLGGEALSHGLVVIHGPNGVGKSSARRALAALLWPEHVSPDPLDVSARFELDGATWTARRFGRGDVAWQCDGADAPAPALPEDHLRHAYSVGVLDLLRADAGDGARELSEEIERQMAGGHDLTAVRARLFDRLPRPKKRVDELRQAEQAVVRRVQEHLAVGRDQQRLDELSERLRRLGEDERRLDDVEAAIERVARREELAAIDLALSQFPPGMESFAAVGRLRERLCDCDEREARGLEEHDVATRALARAEEARDRAGLPGGRAVDEGLLSDCARRLEAVEQAGRDQDGAATRRTRAEQELARARDELGAAEPGAGASPAPDALSRAQEHLDAELELAARRASWQAAREALDGEDQGRVPGAPADIERLVRGEHALLDWLTAPLPETSLRGAGRGASVGRWFALIVLLTLAVWLFAIQVVVPAALVALISVGLAVEAVLTGRRAGGHEVGAGTEARSRFESLELPPPADWSRKAVEERARELHRAVDAARAEGARHETVQRLDRQGDQLDEAEAALLERRSALSRELGVTPPRRATDLVLLVQRLGAWHEAGARLAGETAEHADARSRAAEGLVALGVALAPFRRAALDDLWTPGEHGPVPRDANAARTLLDDVAKRSRELVEAEAARPDLEARCARAVEEVERARRDRAALLGEAGLGTLPASDDSVWSAPVRLPAAVETAIEAREQALEPWRAHDQRRRVMVAASEAAGDDPEGTADRAALEAEADVLRERLGERDELVEERGRILERVRKAEDSDALERSKEDRRRLSDELTESYGEACRRALGDWLLTRVAEEHEAEQRPAVLERATELFGAFTGWRYELQTDPVGRRFRALDTERGLGLSLAELSDGTRAQLLLAARLGFVMGQSRGARPPLVLDEALAGSDPERFEAVVTGLATWVSQEGGQVIALTADPVDVRRWRAAAGDDAVGTIDLGRERGLARRSADESDYAPAPRPEVPDPAGLDPAGYARRLHVEPLDPWADPGALDLFYLCGDDMALCARLRRARLERVGPWRTARRHGARPLGDDPAAARLDLAVGLWEGLVSHWRRGRCPPIDRVTIEGLPITSNKLEEIAVLADHEDVGGDVVRLLDVLDTAGHPLRPSHLRTTVVDALRDELDARGLLPSGDPLDEGALAALTLAELGGEAVAHQGELGAVLDRLLALLFPR